MYQCKSVMTTAPYMAYVALYGICSYYFYFNNIFCFHRHLFISIYILFIDNQYLKFQNTGYIVEWN